ncbi:hypothetical protein [Anaerococcus tetradius]|jgi:hypothetical protein|uniref:hypothetical protein n=1 Tax=Anaerococcus tetradius TaxID=33036 RepID=UPI0023F01293|nr:hypothetical protein [Anaerococcus tetradius]
MLRAIGFLLFSLGYILTIKKTYENYKNEKKLENLMELIASVLISIGTLILAIAYMIG